MYYVRSYAFKANRSVYGMKYKNGKLQKKIKDGKNSCGFFFFCQFDLDAWERYISKSLNKYRSVLGSIYFF